MIRYDPRDLAEIKVYFADGTFLCKAVCQDIADLTVNLRELLSARRKIKKELEGKVKDSKQLLRSLVDSNNKTHKQVKPVIQTTKSGLKLYINE